MNLELNQKRVVVAGSSRGLGRVIAEAFVAEGAATWLSSRNADDLKKTAAELGGASHTASDLETAEGREKLHGEVSRAWDGLDVLVLNVGGGRSSHAGLDAPLAEWQRMLNLNLLTHVELLQRFVPLLRKSKAPSVVSVSSIAGLTSLKAPLSYSAAKAGLNQFCQCSARELAEDGIRINAIAPGNVLAKGGRWEERLKASPKEVQDYINAEVPLKRFATPQEVADLALFLASKRSSFCTGGIFTVDGGQSA